MKINIKGFTFVGFAAAIFAMNAMAAATATNTVTSKSYVDAQDALKQDKDSSTNYKVGQNGNWAAMTSAVTAADGGYITISSGTNGAAVVGIAADDVKSAYGSGLNSESGDLITESVVAAALAANGGTVNTGILTVTQNGVDKGSFNANDSTSPTIAIVAPNWDQSSSDSADYIANKPTITNVASDITDAVSTATKQLPTAYAVQQYVDGAIDAMGNNVAGDSAYISATYDTTTDKTTVSLMSTSVDNAGQVVSGLNSTTGTKLVTDFTLQENLATKQNLDTVAKYHVSNNGTWTTMGSAVTTGNANTISVTEDSNDGSVSVAAVTSSIASNATGLALASDVYNALGGNQIPAQDPTVCTAAHPCALVNEAGALNWRTMAQANYDSAGTCGNLTGNCGDTVQTGTEG